LTPAAKTIQGQFAQAKQRIDEHAIARQDAREDREFARNERIEAAREAKKDAYRQKLVDMEVESSEIDPATKKKKFRSLDDSEIESRMRKAFPDRANVSKSSGGNTVEPDGKFLAMSASGDYGWDGKQWVKVK
jgi:hypothetical protein